MRGLVHSEEASVNIFDNELKEKHRDKAAFLSSNTDPLHETITERLLDRLDDCKDRTFRSVAILSGASGYVLPRLLKREGMEKIVVMDSSNDQLERLRRMASGFSHVKKPPGIEFLKMEGEMLPVEPESFDCEWTTYVSPRLSNPINCSGHLMPWAPLVQRSSCK
jgi:NADH dehydrogenase [ubiquinone] 1 alpha subcomplex assembly factor 5